MLKVREELRSACSWTSSVTWAPLVAILASVSGELKEVTEIVSASRELGDMRTITEAAVAAALATGR